MNEQRGIFLNFILKLSIVFWLFSVLRVLFLVFNYNSFSQLTPTIFLGGIRFDWMTITILFSPYLLSLFVFPFGEKKWQRILFYFSTALAIITNVMDFEYFKYTQKRTTFDLFLTSGLENEIIGLIGSFITDFWYLFVVAFLLFFTTKWLFKKSLPVTTVKLNWKKRVLFSFAILLFYFAGSRGGIQYRPLNVIAASQYASAQNIPLVLNTSFTIIKSSYKKGINVENYFAAEELENLYSPIQNYTRDTTKTMKNVVLIIGESFSSEYIGFLNNSTTYTPFLDSLFNYSYVFNNGFANGKKSIEALPAILSGLPTLMNTAYISSKYAGNKIESLPSFLKDKGYSTHFFHGGANGTMGFNAFAQIAGVDNYYGKDDYPGSGDYDGKWGVFDEPFLKFTSQKLSKQEKPFFAGIFTLSSHHPYTIPEKYTDKFPKGSLPIHESIGYADYALMQFFKKAKKEAWFKNTVFVFTADHTQQNSLVPFNNPIGMYRVPIAIFDPSISKGKIDSTIVSQVDIFPTITNFLGYEANILSFGTSAFSNENPHYSVSFLNGIYQLISEDYFLQFDGEKTIGFYKWKEDLPLHSNLVSPNNKIQNELENYLKAYIQQYQERVVSNKLTAK